LGINTIILVTGEKHFNNLTTYLKSLHKEINFLCVSQKKPKGVVDALSLIKDLIDNNEKIAVILGDNIFESNFLKERKKFEFSKLGAMLFFKKVQNPTEFGVVEIKNQEIISLEEKPTSPKSNLAVTGLYFYDSSIFDKIKKLKKSNKKEITITDINKMYLRERNLGYRIVNGFWSDAGTFIGLKKSREFVEKFLEKEVINSFTTKIKQKFLRGNFNKY